MIQFPLNFNPMPAAIDLGKNNDVIPVAVSKDLKKLIKVLVPLSRKKSDSDFCRELIAEGCARFIKDHFVDQQQIVDAILSSQGKR